MDKVFTGKKDGIYSLYPFDNLDHKNCGVFKVGYSTGLTNRISTYSTSYPKNFYPVEFLKPSITHKRANETKRMFYNRVEKFVFASIIKRGGKPIPRWVNGTDSEWVYASETQVRLGFGDAYKEFEGDITDYSLHEVNQRGEKLKKKAMFTANIHF